MKVDVGRLTEDESKELLEELLIVIKETDIIEILTSSLSPTLKDELVAQWE